VPDDDQQIPEPPQQIPIDGVLDLHTFQPDEIGDLIPTYLEACRERGIFEVRIIHGKGIGNLQRGVHALLKRLPDVEHYSQASLSHGGLGATIVTLKREKK